VKPRTFLMRTAEVKTLPRTRFRGEDISTRLRTIHCGTIAGAVDRSEMGALVYDNDRQVDLEDRTLAHLQVVIVNKLRRRESFPFTWSDERRTITIWISPNTPLEFVYHGNRRPRLNRAWLEELALSASSTGGLVVVPEPPLDVFSSSDESDMPVPG
jgi:hypothetical protein